MFLGLLPGLILSMVYDFQTTLDNWPCLSRRGLNAFRFSFQKQACFFIAGMCFLPIFERHFYDRGNFFIMNSARNFTTAQMKIIDEYV